MANNCFVFFSQYFANFSLPAEKDIAVDGSCAGIANIALLDLSLNTESSNLSFTFMIKDNKVGADLQFVLTNPSDLFKNTTYSSKYCISPSY